MLSTCSISAQSNWEMKKDKDGIQVFTKAYDNSNIKAFRGEVKLQAAPEEVLHVLRDPEATVHWMPRMYKASLLKRHKDGGHTAYFENNAPWPIKNRDGIYRFYFEQRDNGATFINVVPQPDYLPEKKNKIRIKKAESYWHVIPIDSNTTKVIYFAHPDIGGSIPDWLANMSAVSLPFDSLQGLREQILKHRQ